jgi:hypothetical protein
MFMTECQLKRKAQAFQPAILTHQLSQLATAKVTTQCLTRLEPARLTDHLDILLPSPC